MLIDNLVSLVGGRLKNSPKIKMISGFSLDINSLKKGDVLISSIAQDAVKIAVENGAYAIISDKILNDHDEIAIIEIQSLDMVLLQLMRFISISKDIEFICLNALQSSIFKIFSLSGSINRLSNNLQNSFMQIVNAKKNNIFITENEDLLNKFSSTKIYIKSSTKFVLRYKSSPFFTNLILDNAYYLNLNFPYIFAGDLAGVIEFLSNKNINFKIKNFDSFTHFKAIFIDYFFRIKAFGDSDRAFICESEHTLFEREAEFLKSKFNDVLICTPASSKLSKIADFTFSNLNELQKLENFHYALIFCEFLELEKSLNLHPVNHILFN